MKTILCYSGGLDSTTLLYQLQYEGHEVHCVGFDYGQSHRKEMDVAKKLAEARDVPYETVNIDASVFGVTALTGEGARTSEVIVPNRNAIFLSMATGLAIRDGADAVAIGCHGGDHDIWPDCRVPFLDAMAHPAMVRRVGPEQPDMAPVLSAAQVLVGAVRGDLPNRCHQRH